MTIKHINRRGKTYYLHEGKTNTGRSKFYFSQKSEGNLVESIPDGYEIYENPNAQVFLRKIPSQLITPKEILLVKVGIENQTQMIEKRDFFLDIKEKYLVVHVCDQNLDNIIDELVEIDAMNLNPKNGSTVERFLQKTTYSPIMRFTLKDQDSRDFLLERWCFRGSVDDWIELDYNDLPTLVKKYVKHLNQESFFDLHLGI